MVDSRFRPFLVVTSRLMLPLLMLGISSWGTMGKSTTASTSRQTAAVTTSPRRWRSLAITRP